MARPIKYQDEDMFDKIGWDDFSIKDATDKIGCSEKRAKIFIEDNMMRGRIIKIRRGTYRANLDYRIYPDLINVDCTFIGTTIY